MATLLATPGLTRGVHRKSSTEYPESALNLVSKSDPVDHPFSVSSNGRIGRERDLRAQQEVRKVA